jgi:hypothetical protein
MKNSRYALGLMLEGGLRTEVFPKWKQGVARAKCRACDVAAQFGCGRIFRAQITDFHRPQLALFPHWHSYGSDAHSE